MPGLVDCQVTSPLFGGTPMAIEQLSGNDPFNVVAVEGFLETDTSDRTDVSISLYVGRGDNRVGLVDTLDIDNALAGNLIQLSGTIPDPADTPFPVEWNPGDRVDIWAEVETQDPLETGETTCGQLHILSLDQFFSLDCNTGGNIEVGDPFVLSSQVTNGLSIGFDVTVQYTSDTTPALEFTHEFSVPAEQTEVDAISPTMTRDRWEQIRPSGATTLDVDWDARIVSAIPDALP